MWYGSVMLKQEIRDVFHWCSGVFSYIGNTRLVNNYKSMIVCKHMYYIVIYEYYTLLINSYFVLYIFYFKCKMIIRCTQYTKTRVMIILLLSVL